MGFPYATILRPANCFMAALAVYIGSLVAGMPVFPAEAVIFAMVSAFLICGAGMVINDYFDVEIDRVNKPNRPIPAGKITKRMALAYSTILFAAGLAASFPINLPAFAAAVLASVLLVVYAWRLKKMILVGNLSVSALVALTFIFGGLANLNIVPVLSLSLVSFLANTGREIFKSIDDVMGDQKSGVSSLPIKYGVLRARLAGNTLVILAVILSFVPYFMNVFRVGEVYLFFIGIADIVFLVSVVYAKISATMAKLAMFFALVSFLAAALA